jgi:hypothetical protein
MTGATDFTKLVPGFDFLQNLMKGASAGLPNMGQWIAPTLNPEELDKRIGELRTVQFWLEQNARMLGATIQALEVQRMTLSTLQTMNLPLEQLRDSMTLRMPEVEAPAPAPAPASAPEPEPEPAAAAPAAPGPAIAPALGAVDPMQWWGALTKQFTELAASALKDVATVAPAPELAGSQTPAKKAARKSADKSPKTSPKTSAKASARKTTTAAGPRRRAGG